MTEHKFNFTAPHLTVAIKADLPIAHNVSPVRAIGQLYRAYFKFATQQTLTFFKRPANTAK
ncbi:hypothetical protein [Levilactobacillus yiduensis]|uniref:hypothetical protein n=1 Tax=Levilactobacillus yiduensis TaxID=2953880 RepID=UPI000EF34EB2|nr:hypothetical protein [Levilactobacillus yiduensis]AYM02588.1 hypothetical protein D8911_06085 [Levilactobacillus brevis]